MTGRPVITPSRSFVDLSFCRSKHDHNRGICERSVRHQIEHERSHYAAPENAPGTDDDAHGDERESLSELARPSRMP